MRQVRGSTYVITSHHYPKAKRDDHVRLSTAQHVCVQLQKNSRHLGFSLHGGVGSSEGNVPLTVKKIFHGKEMLKTLFLFCSCYGNSVLQNHSQVTTNLHRYPMWKWPIIIISSARVTRGRRTKELWQSVYITKNKPYNNCLLLFINQSEKCVILHMSEKKHKVP